MRIEVEKSRLVLAQWVEIALKNKSYNKTNDGVNDIFTPQDSPIIRLEVGDNFLHLYLNKESFVDYRMF